MDSNQKGFVHDFKPGTIIYGRRSISQLSEKLVELEVNNPLVVCGNNIHSNNELMDRIDEYLHYDNVHVYTCSSPKKNLETALGGTEKMKECSADAIIGVGGGSSLDLATIMSVLYSNDIEPIEIRDELFEEGYINVEEYQNDQIPLVVMPTTFAGADLSSGAGIYVEKTDGRVRKARAFDHSVMPDILVYDPAIYETTPIDILKKTAMNGFNKGIDSLYSRHSEPISDVTSVEGLKYLSSDLPQLTSENQYKSKVMDRVVLGLILVQYGAFVPGRLKLATLHAFGHAFRDSGVHQGLGHAVMTPFVLNFMFEQIDGRRGKLAKALNLKEKDGDLGKQIVAQIESMIKSLGLPTKIQDLEGITRKELPTIARMVYNDHCFENGPPNFSPSIYEIELVLKEAW